jgi:predicted glycosyltransferase
MTRPIGYYVHHHGDGHRRRALAIAQAAPPDTFTLIGTGLAGRTDGIDCLDLCDDRLLDNGDFDGRDDAAERPEALHYAPVHHDGIRQRVARLADWIALKQPSLMVVDVSVEIAMLARLAATPTVSVRIGGLRDDPAHRDAFRGAKALLAPFHQDLDDPATPAWVRAKTRFCPGLTTPLSLSEGERSATVLVVYGLGGAGGNSEELAAAARATPDLNWRVIGPASRPASRPANLSMLGWVADADAEIASAGVVIGAAGDGLVNTVIAAGVPFICLPEPRPFDEQASKARRLANLGAAIAIERWPDPSDWPVLMTAAHDLKPDDQRRLHDPDGARHAAEFLIAIAQEGMPRASE